MHSGVSPERTSVIAQVDTSGTVLSHRKNHKIVQYCYVCMCIFMGIVHKKSRKTYDKMLIVLFMKVTLFSMKKMLKGI